MDALRTKYGAVVLVIHHTGTNPEAQDRGRGNSALLGAVDYQKRPTRLGFVRLTSGFS
jgi:hypothetical protein